MQIVYVGPNSTEKDVVISALMGHEVVFVDTLDAVTEEIRTTAEIISVFVDTVVDAEVLSSFPALRLIAARSVGFNHIAIAEARTRNITVVRVPQYGSQTVAEFTFALMFALSRKVTQAQENMRTHGHVQSLEPYEGFDLGGKTLGVVGTGMIGQRVCAIAKSFGMDVIAYDVYPNELVLGLGCRYVSLETLACESDIVTLHVPSVPATHHMINESILGLMKSTSYLINTSRGEVVDTKALVVALKNNKICGSGLDVLEYEHDLANKNNQINEHADEERQHLLSLNYELMKMPQVIVTPHIGFNTREAKNEITQITIDNISAYIKGSPINIVPV